MKKVLEDYQQGVQYINSEEACEIASIIKRDGILFPFENGELYRGVCAGEQHKVGDIVTVSENIFESWSEDESIAEEFSKERGTDISAVYVLWTGEVKGLSLESYSSEMEWILETGEYVVDEVEEMEYYTKYWLKLA